MINPTTGQPRSAFDSHFSEAIDATWAGVEAIQAEFTALPWFGEHRFDDEIMSLREGLRDVAAEEDDSDDKGESFTNFYYMQFLHDSLDSIVYLPQVHASGEQVQFLTNNLALGLQYGATRALAKLQRDPRWRRDSHIARKSAGFKNEFTPMILLNRPAIVGTTGKVALPSSRQEDEKEAIDFKYMQVTKPNEALSIQAKTHASPTDKIPVNGIVIQATDFNNQKYRTSDALVGEYEVQSNRRIRQNLDGVAKKLLRRIVTLSTPEAKSEARTLHKQAMRTRMVQTPLKFSIGEENPELAALRDRLLGEAS